MSRWNKAWASVVFIRTTHRVKAGPRCRLRCGRYLYQSEGKPRESCRSCVWRGRGGPAPFLPLARAVSVACAVYRRSRRDGVCRRKTAASEGVKGPRGVRVVAGAGREGPRLRTGRRSHSRGWAPPASERERCWACTGMDGADYVVPIWAPSLSSSDFLSLHSLPDPEARPAVGLLIPQKHLSCLILTLSPGPCPWTVYGQVCSDPRSLLSTVTLMA